MTNKSNNLFFEKTALVIVLVLGLTMICCPAFSSAISISLISQANPVQLGETQTVQLSISSNSTAIAVLEFSGVNHTMEQQSSGVWYYTWLPQLVGTLSYQAYVVNTANESVNFSASFVVQDTIGPIITNTSPSSTLNYSLVLLSASTNENSTCKYDFADISYDSMAYSLGGIEKTHTQLRSFSDGRPNIYVRCKDGFGNIGQPGLISFVIDTAAPSISGISPTGLTSSPGTVLRLTTNEPSNCKWSNSLVTYPSMQFNFQTTGGTIHENPTTLSEGLNTFYFSCRDFVGNYNSPILSNVELNQPPSASVDVEKNTSSLKRGTYRFKVYISENLRESPSIRFNCGGWSTTLPIEGSAREWSGYLIVPSEPMECVGEFVYQGIDTRGTLGTEISSGKLVLVDTKAPGTVIGLKLKQDSGKLKLSWSYSGDDADHYNIYKSTSGNTDKSNFKISSIEQSYSDSDVKDSTGYFYRISAVDKAGNEGDLSEEEFIMTEFNSTIFVQDSAILSSINSKIRVLEQKVSSVNALKSQFETSSEPGVSEVASYRDVVESLNKISNELKLVIGELKNYQELQISKQELDLRLSAIDKRLSDYDSRIVSGIKIIDGFEEEQLPDESAVALAANDFILASKFSAAQKQEYLDAVYALQNKVRVKRQIINYEMIYKSGDFENGMLVKQSYISPEDLSGYLVQEILPKEQLKYSELAYSVSPRELNTNGPIWSFSAVKDGLSYELSGKTVGTVRKISTVLLISADSFLSQSAGEKSSITGNVGANSPPEDKQTVRFSWYLSILATVAVSLLFYYLSSISIPKKFCSDEELKAVYALMAKAWLSIKNNDIESAHISYTKALELYKVLKFKASDKAKINKEMKELFDEIVRRLEVI